MSSKVYDILKWIALVFLDAFGLLYQTFAEIWALPYGDEVLKTCVALSVFLGTCLGISNVNYKKNLNEDPEQKTVEGGDTVG